MAIKSDSRKLSEAELYAPDLDEGEVDVEHYPLPDAGEIEDPYLAEVWEAAVQLLDQNSDEDDEGKDGDAEGDEASSSTLEKGLLDSIQSASKFLASRWEMLETRYGRKAALAMAVAMLVTMPLPGTVPAIIAAAEAIRGVRGYFQAEYDGDVEKLAKSGNPSIPETGVSGAATNANYFLYSVHLADVLAGLVRRHKPGTPIPEGILTPQRILTRYNLGIGPEDAAAEIFHDLVLPRLSSQSDWQEDARNAMRNARRIGAEVKGETVMDLDPRLTLRFPINRLRPRDGELK